MKLRTLNCVISFMPFVYSIYYYRCKARDSCRFTYSHCRFLRLANTVSGRDLISFEYKYLKKKETFNK